MYLDPGFGSMVIQMLVAAFAVGGVALFSLRQKIAQFFSRKKKKNMEVKKEVSDDGGEG